MDKKQIPAAAGQTVRSAVRRVREKVKGSSPASLRRILTPIGIFIAGLMFGGTDIIVGVYPLGTALLCAASGWTGPNILWSLSLIFTL